MSEHPYKPQPWRLTDYYPESYARFVDTLNNGVVPDWDDADHDRHEAEFRADLAAHDAEVAAQALRQAADEASQEGERILGGMPDTFSGLGRERGRRMDDAQECRARANWLRDRADQIEREQG